MIFVNNIKNAFLTSQAFNGYIFEGWDCSWSAVGSGISRNHSLFGRCHEQPNSSAQ